MALNGQFHWSRVVSALKNITDSRNDGEAPSPVLNALRVDRRPHGASHASGPVAKRSSTAIAQAGRRIQARNGSGQESGRIHRFALAAPDARHRTERGDDETSKIQRSERENASIHDRKANGQT